MSNAAKKGLSFIIVISMAVLAIWMGVGRENTERDVDKPQFKILAPDAMMVRDIAFNVDGSRLTIAVILRTTAGIRRKCIEYSIAEHSEKVLTLDIDSVSRWGSDMVACQVDHVSILKDPRTDTAPRATIAKLPADEGVISSVGLITTNGTDIGIVPRWVSYSFEQKKEPIQFVFGDSPQCMELRSWFEHIHGDHMQIRAVALSHGPRNVVAISFSDDGQSGVGVAEMIAEGNAHMGNLERFKFTADEPPAIAIDPSGNHLACLARTGTTLRLFSVENGLLLYTIEFERTSDEFDVATKFAGRMLDISQDGLFVGAVTTKGGVVLELLTGKQVKYLPQPVTSVGFNPQDRQIAFGFTKPGRVEAYSY